MSTVFRLISLGLTVLLATPALCLGEKKVVLFRASPNAFTLADAGQTPPMLLDDNDWPGVLRAAGDFRQDVVAVTGLHAETLSSVPAAAKDIIIVGTLDHSRFIDKLSSEGKIDAAKIRGQWEAGLIAVVEHPMPGVERALVIAGSDKRGTIFALYTLSEQIGVSPWAWWADVRIPHQDALYVSSEGLFLASPAVRYRGIFLNDEAPALSGWAHEKFGGFNHKFYEHVFQLLLRLRANYLWPAMWGNAFNEDDPLNPKLADEYGIVMGTSHHEPMLRAQQEWKRHGKGPWDYSTNAAELATFWAKGIERNREYESTITVGMRGDGDMPMSDSANVSLLERIVADQRKIIAAYGDPKHPDPQVWALYKEVQEYYEKGMRVPDDVTLLWSDDNWGNLRRVPTAEERNRAGGAGIYYHFDYVGGPRSYKWLNTYSITKVWEQMNLAVQYGADRIWIVNVGDLKPMEFPMEFFLTMARDPKRWGKDDLDAYTVAWATREFGAEHAKEIATLVERYTQYNSRRKPELLTPETYSFTEGDEASRVEQQWQQLARDADRIAALLPDDERASYFELVQYPVDACANLGEMYIAAGRNHLYAKQGRASANQWADQTEKLFARDAELSQEYNSLLNGKWHHMMDQTHIGYTSWNDPPRNRMPDVSRVPVPSTSSAAAFTEEGKGAAQGLRPFDSANRQVRLIDIALTGSEPVEARLTTSTPWITTDWSGGTITSDKQVRVFIDWTKAPSTAAEANITLAINNGAPVTVPVHILPAVREVRGFVEEDGIVAIDAVHTARNEPAGSVRWEPLPGFGPVGSGIEAFPLAASVTSAGSGACVAYDFTLLSAGDRTLQAILAPTLKFSPKAGLRFTVEIDHERSRTIDASEHFTEQDWNRAVSDGVHRVSASLGKLDRGAHTLRICSIDPGVVLERLILFRTQPAEYLGPPESQQSPSEPKLVH